MRDELRAYLDGELEPGDLPPELREEARAWEALFGDVRAAGPEGAPEGLEAEVMEEIRAIGPRGAPAEGGEAPDQQPAPAWRRAVRWLLEPRPVPVPPAAVVATAAAALLIWLWPGGERPGGPSPVDTSPAATTVTDQSPAGAARVYVEFVMEAPDASSVAVAGDFNGWEPRHQLSDPDGDGVWSGRVPLRPGVHEYMFVIDGSRWVTDPNAQRYSDDGFGHRNAVLAIASPRRGT